MIQDDMNENERKEYISKWKRYGWVVSIKGKKVLVWNQSEKLKLLNKKERRYRKEKELEPWICQIQGLTC